MPRIGKSTALMLVWGLLGASLICAGCTADRDAILSESESPMWDTVPPSGPVAPAAMTVGQAEPRPSVLPGAMPPVVTQPGAMPPVVTQPGAMPPGAMLPGAMPPGAMAHGAMPPGAMPPGLLPPGAMPPGAMVLRGTPWDPVGTPMPRELDKVSHPTYRLQPPDVLLIDAARLVPLPPYKVEPLDSLALLVQGTLPTQPIQGVIQVDASGRLNLGFNYGSVTLIGQTLDEAKHTIENHLKAKLKPPYDVYVALAETKVIQQIRGDHLVRQDGTIGLGTYGSVYVTGLTIAEAKAKIEKHLEKFLFRPQLSVDIAGFNSHVYYVIYEFPGTGEFVFRMPITGNETVLDALGNLRFLPAGVSKRRIWVARPAPAKCCRTQILPVDWQAITRNGSTATNYQLLPGDRVYVAPDPCSNLDAQLARLFSPVERVFGIILLGNSTIQNFRLNAFGATGAVR